MDKLANYHFIAFFVARCARFISLVTGVRGCFCFSILICLDNSLLYLLRLRRFGLGTGISATDGEVMSDMSPPFAERTRSMSASYSSIVIVTVANLIPPSK